MRRSAAAAGLVVATLPLAASACDGLVGLPPPARETPATDSGATDASAAPDGSSAPVEDAGADSDATVTGFSMQAQGPSSIEVGTVRGIAVAGGSVYALEPTTSGLGSVALFRADFAIANGTLGTQALRWTGESSGRTATAITSMGPGSSTVAFAAFDPSGQASQILSVDALADSTQRAPPAPTVVADLTPAALGPARITPVVAMASDGTSVFWTQGGDPFATLFRYDIGSSGPPRALFTSTNAGDSLSAVAVDETYVYTIGGIRGTVYAVPKDSAATPPGVPTPGVAQELAEGAIAGLPIVAYAGSAYYVYGSAGASTGAVYATAPSEDGGVAIPSLEGHEVGPFVIAGCWFAFGSSVGGLTLAPLGGGWSLGGPAAPVEGIVAGSGYVAYFGGGFLTVYPDPPCPVGAE